LLIDFPDYLPEKDRHKRKAVARALGRALPYLLGPNGQPRPQRHCLEAEGFRLPVRPDWLKIKNADTPAVKREAEEDWGR
jgi:hypothetical protein